jgi:hypothetical protein
LEFFKNVLNVLISTFCVCADDFQGLQKLFTSLYNYYLLDCFLKLFTNLKILTETLLIIPFSVIGRCSPVSTSHWLQGKCARIIMSQAASGMILQNYRRHPVSFFSCQNRRFRVSEAGYLKDFQNLVCNYSGAG